MPSTTSISKRIGERGPRWIVTGDIRPGEALYDYANTAEVADRLSTMYEEQGYRNVRIYAPVGSVDLAALGRARTEAERVLAEHTAMLRAGVLRALEAGRSESEVALTGGINRSTVRKWAGKTY